MAYVMRDDEEELVSDIGYAIRKSGLHLQKGQGIEDCRAAARKVVIHLRKCLWKFERNEAYEPIGSFENKSETGDDRETSN